MDERQQQIKAGAGLEDSRVNEDFKEFLEKWGFWMLLLVAAGFGSIAGVQWLERQRIEKVDSAFAAYEGATGTANPNPEALIRVADEFEGVRAIPDLSRLRSADIYLQAARSGLRPGAEYTPEGELMNEDDLLSDEQIGRYLDQAQSLYAQVLERSRTSGSVLSIDSAFGLAAVAESKGDAEAARRAYATASEMANEHGRPVLARVADGRGAELSEGVPERMALYSEADLPELPVYTPQRPDPVETRIPVIGGESEGLAPPLPELDEPQDEAPPEIDPEAEPEAAPDPETDAPGDDAP